jgi:hypothetical protein
VCNPETALEVCFVDIFETCRECWFFSIHNGFGGDKMDIAEDAQEETHLVYKHVVDA